MPKFAHPKARVNLKKKSAKDKSGYLYLNFTWNGNRFVYPLTFFLNLSEPIASKDFDAKKGLLKALGKNRERIDRHNAINAKLNEIKRHVEQFHQQNQNLSKDSLKTELEYYTGKKQRPMQDGGKHLNFFEFIEAYVKEAKEHKSEYTFKKLNNTKNHLAEYAKDYQIKIDYDNIDWKFKTDFVNWLYSEPRKHSQNTAAKNFKVIKHFLRVAHRRKYHNNLIFNEKSFSLKTVKTKNKVRLTFDELKDLQTLTLPTKKLEKTRDLFLVGCYTGQRFGDWGKINSSNIKKDEVELIEVLTDKTKQKVIIPLLPPLKNILEKYNYELPTLSNQKFNEYIKEVCELAAVDTQFLRVYSEGGKTKSERIEKYKKVGSHAARRSFATNFYELGFPPFILMQITGHTTEKQFFEYIDADPKKLALEFAKMAAKSAEKIFV